MPHSLDSWPSTSAKSLLTDQWPTTIARSPSDIPHCSVRFLLALVPPCSQLYGAPVCASDLRAGAALVLAGMAAEGTTHIQGVAHIDRGYEQIDKTLRLLGAGIRRRPCLPAELNI